MRSILVVIYGVLAYAAGLGVLAGFVLWVAPWPLLPWHIDIGTRADLGLGVDLGLLLLFGLQHSLMARAGFKRRITAWLPRTAVRSTYVLLSALALGLLCLAWKPLPGLVWNVEQPFWHGLLTIAFVGGWGMSVWATFLIDHFELFGLRQVWNEWRGQQMPPPVFREVSLYRVVRHPMQLGVLIGLWATPRMSAGHLLLAVGMSLYVLLGLYFEERDLLRELGEPYRDYRRRVPQLIPGLRARR
jgi:protein-S-isoprenylcysteine O-methyltransferase Ste14